MAGGDAAADADAGADADADADAGAEEEVAADGSQNVQAFDGALGGAAPAVVFTDGADRPFEVNGATFLNAGAALQRSCAVQKNAWTNLFISCRFFVMTATRCRSLMRTKSWIFQPMVPLLRCWLAAGNRLV